MAILLKKKLTIPIYDAELWVVVADKIADERKKFDDVFGKLDGDPNDYDGVSCYNGGHIFGIFYTRKALTMKVLSHEVFHVTHRILEWASCNFDKEHHEQGALLHGYLMDLVWRETRRLKT